MNLKEIKQRIQSVKSTQKITSAMKLVSAAKLRRAQSAIENMRPYQHKLNEMMTAFLHDTSASSCQFEVREVKKVVLVIVSSDSSLCGGFNANIIRKAKERIEKYTASGVLLELMPVGRKIYEALRKMGYEQNSSLCNQSSSVSYNAVSKVALEIMERFSNGEIDRVELLYTHFHSAAKQEPVNELFLPFDNTASFDGKEVTSSYIVEPDREAIVKKMLPKVVILRLYAALLDSLAAEHAARMMAMQIATDNADDLISELVREYNKGRQQAITNELLDIVGGSMN